MRMSEFTANLNYEGYQRVEYFYNYSKSVNGLFLSVFSCSLDGARMDLCILPNGKYVSKGCNSHSCSLDYNVPDGKHIIRFFEYSICSCHLNEHCFNYTLEILAGDSDLITITGFENVKSLIRGFDVLLEIVIGSCLIKQKHYFEYLDKAMENLVDIVEQTSSVHPDNYYISFLPPKQIKSARKTN